MEQIVSAVFNDMAFHIRILLLQLLNVSAEISDRIFCSGEIQYSSFIAAFLSKNHAFNHIPEISAGNIMQNLFIIQISLACCRFSEKPGSLCFFVRELFVILFKQHFLCQLRRLIITMTADFSVHDCLYECKYRLARLSGACQDKVAVFLSEFRKCAPDNKASQRKSEDKQFPVLVLIIYQSDEFIDIVSPALARFIFSVSETADVVSSKADPSVLKSISDAVISFFVLGDAMAKNNQRLSVFCHIRILPHHLIRLVSRPLQLL